ncbi:MAG TPA: isoprenyl transferase [Bacteroidetes bacterium]|nr:isoprenyl transferase [Bacteroidota bacterium]
MPVQLSDTPQTDADRAAQATLQSRGEIPAHIACIMDGNGRWAKSRGKRRATGHRVGVESVREVTEACAQLGVEHLTLYTFSTENWQRPRAEVTALMELLVRTIRREAEKLHANGIRLRALGDLSRLPSRAQREMEEAMRLTEGNTRMTLGLALSYSGRWEITEAARQLAARAAAGTLDPAAITEADVAASLPSAATPDPDLLIRTGGDFRVSNFLLWQIAYSEIVVTDTLWPDFRREALYAAVREFQNRDRRFGRVEDDEPASVEIG